MSDNSGVNFAGWVIGVVLLLAVGMPIGLALLCCVGGALAGGGQ